MFHFSSKPLVWSSKKQKVFSLLITEDEYCGVVNVGSEAICIQKLLGEIGFPVKALNIIHCDNQSEI